MLTLAPSADRRGSVCQRPIPRLHVAGRAGATLVASFCLLGMSAQAQVIIANGTLVVGDSTKPTASFSLPTQPADVKDAVDEFQRMVKHEQWEKAFKSLETIAGKTSTGYLDRKDGVLVPSRLLVRSLLASLPAAGKNAYRLFYDSQATALWDKAVGKNEAGNLATIVANHVISSVGDRAADRLGDLYFEQGDMDKALVAWRSIVDYCPDSKLSKAQVLVKMATVLARDRRWSEFREIEKTVRERYAAEVVEIGGRRVTAAEQMGLLGSAAQAVEPVVEAAPADDVELPGEVEPLWQFRFQSKADPLNPNQPFTLMDVYGRQRPNDFTIPAAADEKRVYVNLFGVEMAFDLASGKLLWRSGKLHSLQLQQGRQGVAPERYSIVLSGDRTWSVLRDPQQNNQNNQMNGFALMVREAATGKEVFSTRRTLSSWTILGPPYPAGDVVYVGGSRSNQGREMSVLVLDAKDGKLLKTVTVGNHAVDQNQVYGERIAQPSFLLHRDRLFIDTHAGALVSMQPRTGDFDWGILYDSPPPSTGYNYYNSAPPQFGVSGPVYSAGLMFAKGMRSARLLGVQTDSATLAWNRSVANSAVILGIDDDRVYLGGEELTAYSLKTQELLWATQLPLSAAWCVPLLTRHRLYQFTSRGVCEVDKETGAVVKIFRGVDLDAFGGAFFVTPQALVTVSNLAITAYPRSPGGPTSTN